MVQAREINLADLLRFEPEEGLIWLKDYRMLMLSACALGALRKELIATLGWVRARGLMKRFGYAAGLADGLALAKRFPQATGARHMTFGPALHALEGFVKLVRIPERSEVDLDRGRFHVEGYWDNSFEAEQHLELLGPSQEPVCWMLMGYALGHSSAAAERETIVVETECRAMGHERCRFVAGLADEMPELARREEHDYAPQHLPEMLQDLLKTLKRQKRDLRSKEKTIEELRSEVERARSRGAFIGDSERLAAALDTAQSVSPYKTTVLLLGESGTGKELLARFIHEQSPQAGQPFVAVNCSALPENLQEAELFGHAKGAFTGATSASAGVFEAAHRGTLFLDEIGDLALTAQTKILRALQEGEIKRVGETRARKADPRIIAATHQDLAAMVQAKTFREDLYYRLNVVAITLPPLRDRGNDTLLLAEHFLRAYAEQFGKEVGGLSRDARCAIAEYAWPGNVRELDNAVQRAVILAGGREIELDDLPTPVVTGSSVAAPQAPSATARETSPLQAGLLRIGDEAERIERALELAAGNRERAARLLGISRTTLWRKIKALSPDLSPPGSRFGRQS
ncbi:MAG: sigma-54-dependent Fis family transcriptional regulator [Acidobacteriota bacterium]